MRTDVSRVGDPDVQRNATLLIYPKGTEFAEVLKKTATAFDLTPFISRARHSAFDATVQMTWDGTGSFLANQPKPGDILRIEEHSVILWIGFVDEVNNFNEERGNRTLSITCRSRDGVGILRKGRVASKRYPQGTLLNAMAEDILRQLGLDENEFVIPLGGEAVPHSNVQFAEQSPWKILEQIGTAMGRFPYTNAKGQITFGDRQVDRVSTITMTNTRVKRIVGGKSRPALARYRLKWLDRNLTEIVQAEQTLGSWGVTAGFFQLNQRKRLFWSEDERQRAKNTRFTVLQSVNDSLLPIGSETYFINDLFSGTVTVSTSNWVPVLATLALAVILILDYLFDFVVVGGIVVSVGVTIPFGRVIHGIAEAILLLILMSLGTGSYEIIGEPFDFVHSVNTTIAIDDASPKWMEAQVTEENDLIYDEAHAQQVVVRELLHRIAEQNKWDAQIIDDPRIEPGDIIELPDTSRVFVQDYERNLTRGSPALLTLRGFRA